ncbi:MAG: hypothetical protein WBM43_13065 [Flavobacteriaceae bacterium]
MTRDVSAKKQKNVAGWYREVNKWVSEIHFVQDEIVFAKKLLNSDVFEPNVPNLFERIREYLGLLESFEEELAAFEAQLVRHERGLGTFLEIIEPEGFKLESRHLELAVQLAEIIGRFKMLKSEIFQYAGGILRRKRK